MNDTTKNEELQIAPTGDGIVMPAVNAQEAIEAWKVYQELKHAIVTKEDIQQIQGKDFLKKSYWRKVATFFNLSVDVIEEKKEAIGKTFVWHFTVKASAPNGRYAIGVGSCDAYEKATLIDGKYVTKGKVKEWGKSANGKSFPKEFEWTDATPNSIHNIRSTAETRAFNRAVSNLVGGGEVSAEEVSAADIKHEVIEPNETDSEPEVQESGILEKETKCEVCGDVNGYHKKACPNGNKTGD